MLKAFILGYLFTGALVALMLVLYYHDNKDSYLYKMHKNPFAVFILCATAPLCMITSFLSDFCDVVSHRIFRSIRDKILDEELSRRKEDQGED